MRVDETEDLPRVTAGLLRAADTMCARRLHREHQGTRGNRRADTRFRVANQFVDDARLSHVDLAPPSPGHFHPATDLLPEQQRVYELAARWYVQLFSEDAVRFAPNLPGTNGLNEESESLSLGLGSEWSP